MSTIDAGEPSPELDDAEAQMRRLDLFRRAHAAVSDLTWGENVSVYDVLQVARFLEEKEEN
ncbi:hypothetical protein [Streptomyces fulvorobeus]|uniref:Uncharacterized protein n=1 Tax=Streptomyces fulvorobeus TaxID=284028 RepID=A0A7J0CE13_9ACTN|nr:hypothetical protein [Streptomyces fulvorobeus]NYE44225.1 hypothetical protein [Streptomyces fulvorobeus]GFN00740.1 hypothetical protein Sfulv_55500 [Streptomyces fulvorobeus]